MENVSWDRNIIIINDMNIVLDYDVLEIKELNDIVLVVTVPEVNVLDNLFGVCTNTGNIWRVQRLAEVYPEFSQTPYVGVSIVNNEVLVTDFCGCRFIVNPVDGTIVGRASETR